MSITSFKYLSRDLLEVRGAEHGKHARQIAEDVTCRTTTLVKNEIGDIYHVHLNQHRPSPETIILRARERGLYLNRGRIEWDAQDQAWKVDSLDPEEWLNIYATTDSRRVYVVARRWHLGEHTTASAWVVCRIAHDSYLVEFLTGGQGSQRQAALREVMGVAPDDVAALESMPIS
jgi:hypothetical protein